MITWQTKETTTNSQEAVEAIADFISSSDGVSATEKDKLDDVEAFAKKWKVPFNRALMVMTIDFLGTKRWNGDGARFEERTDEEWIEQLRADKDWKEQVDEALEGVDPDEQDDNLYDLMLEYKDNMGGEYHCWQSSSEGC